MMERKEIPRFCLHVLKGRWLVVLVSFYIMSCSGTGYIFGIYSGAIKSALHYDQTTISTLGFFKDLGGSVGIVSGLLNEIAPAWAILAMGAGMNLFGFTMMWLAATHHIAKPPVWQMYLYMCVAANSVTFANTGVLVVCVRNFPQSRGIVLGLLKGFLGLSGAIFTQFYHALYGQDSINLILLIGWLPCLVTLLFMFLVRPMKPEMDKHENQTFFSFLYLSLLLAGFLMLVIILENRITFSSSLYKVMGLLTLLLIVANIWVGMRAEMKRFERNLEQPSSIQYSCNEEEKQLEQKGFKVSDHDSEAATPTTHDMSATTIPTHDSQAAIPTTHDKSADDYSASSIQTPDHSKQANQDGHADEGHMANKSGQLHESKQPDQGHADEDHMAHKGEQLHETRLYAKVSNIAEQDGGIILTASAQTELVIETDKSTRSLPQRGDDFTIPQALLSLDMWILFLANTCGTRAALAAIDNMGQIGASLGYSPISISTFVSLISIWSFLGRVIAGFSSEVLLQRYGFPRTLMLTIFLSLACVGHLMIALPSPGSLYVACILVGLCLGGQAPLASAVISELFGLKRYATLLNVGGLASPLGSYLLNVRVVGYLYDQEARKQTSSDLTCVGSQCFRMAFLIMTAVSFFGSLVSLYLVARTRKFYTQDIYAKFRKAVEKEGDIGLS